MSTKYANLPDIDTAPDIYETEDVFPSSQANKGDSSDEETSNTRFGVRGKNDFDVAGKDELDSSNLIGAEEASKKFRKAEKRRERQRTHFTHPPSPTSTTAPSSSKPPTLSSRLAFIRAELASLEAELSDPSNPLLAKERIEDNVDPGELIRGLVDVKARISKITKGKEGRGRLVSVVIGEGESPTLGIPSDRAQPPAKEKPESKTEIKSKDSVGAPDVRTIAEMDRRVGELEALVGSSTAALDETTPLPPPLLPLVTRLSNQLQILTQPRHIDSISRRLKLLISDLERASAAQQHAQRRSASNAQQQQQPSPATISPPLLQEQLFPLLARLGPSLPHIPHILTRLRTLSTLHTAAGEFQRTLESLEEEQRRMREGLGELRGAVEKVEASLEENRSLVKGNVQGLEGRIELLLGRVDELVK